MISNTRFDFDSDNKELLPTESGEFPFLCNYTDMTACIRHTVPWHWHPALEFDYVTEGELELRTPENTIRLRQGDIHMIEKFVRIVEYAKEESPGYEFEIRSELGRLWFMLYEETEDIREQKSGMNVSDAERIKKMLDFITRNYMEAITLADIAASAYISARECTRCFQRTLGISPIRHLNEYRLDTAASMLLAGSDPILTISEKCGFSSVSYFGKAFHSLMKCTPSEFRKLL